MMPCTFPSLPMKTLLTPLLALGLAASLAAEKIDLGAGRSAHLTVPDAWKAAKVLEGLPQIPADATALRYVTKSGSNDAVLLTLLPVPDEQLADPANLQQMVEASTRQFVDGSVERKAYLKDFKVAGKSGYACLFTDAALVDRPPVKDDYKTITVCFVYLGDKLLLAATILSDDPSAPAFGEARRLLQSLTLTSAPKPI